MPNKWFTKSEIIMEEKADDPQMDMKNAYNQMQ